MATDERALRAAFQKLASQQQERMERLHQTMNTESDKLKKGLGAMIRQYQDRIQQIYGDIQTESDAFQKNLEKMRKAVFQIIEDASVRNEKAAEKPKKPAQVDDLVNNPPNCTACEFPMVVLKEDQEGGETQVHFVCPICNLDSKATVSADGSKVNWQKSEPQPAAG
jgi:rubrerythrin